jgi:hypothetical protein
LFAETSGLNKEAQAEARRGVRTTSLAVFGGALAVLGAYFTAKTYRLSREGHITDRFTRAIDQLGSTALDVRLGGIYALERIASPDRLCARACSLAAKETPTPSTADATKTDKASRT